MEGVSHSHALSSLPSGPSVSTLESRSKLDLGHSRVLIDDQRMEKAGVASGEVVPPARGGGSLSSTSGL